MGRLWLAPRKRRRNLKVCDNPLYPHTLSHRRRRSALERWEKLVLGRGQARSECVAGLGTERERLDLSLSLTRMEVASALLEASKKLSGSADSSTSSSCSATATWSSSMSEVNDKTGELPNSSALMGGWGKRTRASSESEGMATMSMGSWWSGMRERSGSSPGNQGWFSQPRVLRSSSKDVEEAMAGGLNKSEIFMPPM